MRQSSKIILFCILPVFTLISFIIIGTMQTYHEYLEVNMPTHHAMSSGIYMSIWILRGIYSMLLVFAILFVLFSMVTNQIKAFTILLLVFLNAPILYIILDVATNPGLIMVIAIGNIIAFAPFYNSTKFKRF